MAFENLTYEKKDRVGWITINRPESMNVINMATVLELEKAVDGIEVDNDVWVGVITGAGDRAFSSGADLKEVGKLDFIWNMNYSKSCRRIFGKIEGMGKPFIAGINGLAMGGGFELLLACPLRIMSEKAHLSFPELSLGAIPGAGGTQRLSRLIGKSRATWYTLTGERIYAENALNIGLVHKVVTPEQVQAECEVQDLHMHWNIFRDKVLLPTLGNRESQPMKAICARLGIESESRAFNMLLTVKRRFKAALRRNLANTVLAEEDIDKEWQDLLKIFS